MRWPIIYPRPSAIPGRPLDISLRDRIRAILADDDIDPDWVDTCCEEIMHWVNRETEREDNADG